MPRALRAVAVGVVTLGVLGCTDSGRTEVVGPGAVDEQAVPDVRPEAALDLASVDPPARVPGPTVTLEPADWPEVAAWVRRETGRDRPVLINFFASYCEPCKRELPLLIDTAADEADVTFLGVHTAEDASRGARMVEEFGIDLPTFTDPSTDVLTEVGGRVLPYTVVFDVDGRLAGRVFGELTGTSLDALLAAGRGEAAAAPPAPSD